MMFKKVEVWIIYLVSLLNVAFTLFFGVLVRQELVGTQKLGFISKAALFVVEVPVNYKRLFLGDQIVNKDRFPKSARTARLRRGTLISLGGRSDE